MENYKKAVSPFPVIKAKQSKHYFNLCCISGSHLLHHFTGLSLTLPNVGCLYFFSPTFLHLFFLKLSLKFLYNFHFSSVTFLCSIVFVDIYHYTTSLHFYFYSLFKILYPFFSFYSLCFHHFLNAYFLSHTGKCKSHTILKYNFSPTTLAWCDQILGCQFVKYWPEEITFKSWISSYLLNYNAQKCWNDTTAHIHPTV